MTKDEGETRMANKLDARIAIRLSDETYQLLEELRELGMNPSELVRDLIETATPGLEMLRDGLVAQREGRKPNLAEGIGKVILKVMKAKT